VRLGDFPDHGTASLPTEAGPARSHDAALAGELDKYHDGFCNKFNTKENQP